MKKILIPRLQEKFLQLIDDYRRRNDLNWRELSDQVGLPASHIASLRTKSRILSMNYIFKFILKGVFYMSDIYDGNAESDRELEFWEFAKLIEAKPILEKITCAQKLGLDIEAFLDGYIYSVEKRNNNLK